MNFHFQLKFYNYIIAIEGGQPVCFWWVHWKHFVLKILSFQIGQRSQPSYISSYWNWLGFCFGFFIFYILCICNFVAHWFVSFFGGFCIFVHLIFWLPVGCKRLKFYKIYLLWYLYAFIYQCIYIISYHIISI